jgi:acyl carrier protein
MRSTYRQFKQVYSEVFFVKPEDIHLKKSFTKGLKMNEFEFNEMLVSLEYYFKIEIPDEEFPKLRLVKDVVKCIERLAA